MTPYPVIAIERRRAPEQRGSYSGITYHGSAYRSRRDSFRDSPEGLALVKSLGSAPVTVSFMTHTSRQFRQEKSAADA